MSVTSLPTTWQSKLAIDCFEQISTTNKKVQSKDYSANGKYPVIDQGQSFISGYTDDETKLIKLDSPICIFGDHTRIIKWVKQDFVPGADGTKLLKPRSFMFPRYAYYSLCALNIPDKGYSRHFKYFKEIEIKIPGWIEQKIIAEKLDTLLAQVDSTKTRLEKIPQVLKRFRQAILAAAVCGKLITIIDSEHKKTIELGNDLIRIPENWAISKLDSTINKSRPICYGVVQPGDDIISGELLIRVCDINNGEVALTSLRKISQDIDNQYRRSKVQKDDILVTIVGAIGRIGIIRNNINANIARAVARLSPDKNIVSPMFLHIWLSSPVMQTWLVSSSKEVARKTLNLKELKDAPVPLPSIEEQHEIVRRVEQLFAYADTIEKQVNTTLERVNNLTQSILAKAFRGELTAQWRAENPDLITGENSAAALLEKIKAERATSGTKKNARKKS